MIKKGDKFKCIKSVCINDNPNEVAYDKNKIYISEKDGCITDNDGDINHKWHDDWILDFFIRITDTSESQKEMVNHPSHYKNNKYECIDVMLDVFGKDKTAAFCELNAFKYLWRADNKGTDIQDKKKAIWYLNKYIELKENKDE